MSESTVGLTLERAIVRGREIVEADDGDPFDLLQEGCDVIAALLPALEPGRGWRREAPTIHHIRAHRKAHDPERGGLWQFLPDPEGDGLIGEPALDRIVEDADAETWWFLGLRLDSIGPGRWRPVGLDLEPVAWGEASEAPHAPRASEHDLAGANEDLAAFVAKLCELSGANPTALIGGVVRLPETPKGPERYPFAGKIQPAHRTVERGDIPLVAGAAAATPRAVVDDLIRTSIDRLRALSVSCREAAAHHHALGEGYERAVRAGRAML